MAIFPGESQWGSDDTRDEWVLCPNCRHVMLELRDYEIQTSGEYPAIEADGVTFFLWGWTVFLCQIAWRFLSGLVTFRSRQRKLAKLKADLLNHFPNSLVCPQCLGTIKRR